MDNVVNNFEVCNAISNLLKELESRGFKLEDQDLRDYHFKEMYFKMSGNLNLIENFSPSGVKRIKNKFICECHWSTIEIVDYH